MAGCSSPTPAALTAILLPQVISTVPYILAIAVVQGPSSESQSGRQHNLMPRSLDRVCGLDATGPRSIVRVPSKLPIVQPSGGTR
jgi:hypothetical protein